MAAPSPEALTVCPAPSAAELLARHFGYATFRPGQAEAIAALAAGRDVVALMPTGAGKSVCYQIPALQRRQAGGGTTLVISPLIALMKDQVEGLRARGVAAAALHSAQDELEQRAVVGQLLTGKVDLLYVSPERAALEGFRRLLQRCRVALLAIDEAHCISQWGHDFRPEYARLGELRGLLGVPSIALTATATPHVRQEIEQLLGLREPARVIGDFRRPNLHFAVRPLRTDGERLEALVQALTAAGLRQPASGRAIVYCATRKKVEAVVEQLRSRGFAAGFYHAGRTDTARDRVQEAFEQSRTRVLVATNAFGMGVDLPNVRLLVHFQMPGSVEAYYQEAGRAGRDGEPAHCLLFFGASDFVTQRFMMRKSPPARLPHRERLLAAMEDYARARTCRQAFLAGYFTGERHSDGCGRCDLCSDDGAVSMAFSAYGALPAPKDEGWTPLDDAARALVVDAVAHLSRPVGKVALAKALRGSHAKELRRLRLLDIPQHGSLRGYAEAAILDAIEELLRDGRLERRGQKYPTVWLAGRPVRVPTAERSKASRAGATAQSPLVRALRNYRQRTARKLNWKGYMVLQNAVIERIAQAEPRSRFDLEHIRGLGPAKIERFGADILRLVEEHGSPS